jgi:hypothetical protein
MADRAQSQTITSGDVKSWFGDRTGFFDENACDEMAKRLNRMRNSGNPSDTDIDVQEDGGELDWRDFKATINAAKCLSGSMQNMLSHWESLQKGPPPSPEWLQNYPDPRDGYAAIKNLESALSAALHYIEFPFGKYEPTHRHQSNWHIPAFCIATSLYELALKEVHLSSADTIGVKFIEQALRAIGCKPSSTEAIRKSLQRFYEKYGKPPKKDK